MGADFDFVVFGSGFSGSIMSMVLRRLGASVLLVEKGSHPRFVIGESSTPFANLLLERIADEFDLPVLRPFAKWGTWQEQYPEIGCGLKRGFTFFHHRAGERLDPFARDSQMLVGASPNDAVADTHWYRPDFDQFLMRAAIAEGVEYLERTELAGLGREEDWVVGLKRANGTLRVRGRFLIDAAGRSSALSQQLGVKECGWGNFPRTDTIYAHYREVPRRFNALSDEAFAGRWPYPPDDAAMHHVFEGGWIWVLHFNNGVTSAGAVLTERKAGEMGLDRVSLVERWERLVGEHPGVADLFQGAKRSTPLYTCAGVAYRRGCAAGDRFALLPSSAGFVDPLLSTGFALTLLGVLRLGRIFRMAREEWNGKLESYSRKTLAELDATAELVGGLYASLQNFEQFRQLALLYFAALSFTESAWRLGREGMADSFLLCGNREFSWRRGRICQAARSGKGVRRSEVLEAISPIDVAGLSDERRHPWYPARPEDLYAGCGKLGVRAEEIERMLKRCGLRGQRGPNAQGV